MRVYLSNTFSLSMLRERYHLLECRQLDPHITALLLYVFWGNIVNVIAQQELDEVVNALLTLHVKHLPLPKPDPRPVLLAPNDALVVAMYAGPQLEPGTTTLPDDAQITFWLVHQCRSPNATTIAELIDAYQTAYERETQATKGQAPSYAHWEGVIYLTRRSDELGARPVEVLEALQQLSTYAGF